MKKPMSRDFPGLGKDLCRICGLPTVKHKIGPCPFLGDELKYRQRRKQ